MLKETTYQKNTFQIFVVLIPYLSFLNVNNQELDLVIYQTILLMFLATILSIFLLSKVVYLVFKKIDYKNIQFFLTFSFYSLFFLYAFFKDLIHPLNPIYEGNISFLLIILLFFSIIFLFFYFKNQKIIKFIVIYFFLNFLLNIVSLGSNFFYSLSQETTNNVLFNKKQIEDINKKNKRNIYYLILDGALPLNIFSEEFGFKEFDETNYKFNSLGYNLIKNTKSSYHQTKYTFASILNLSYYINEKNYTSVKTGNLFPKIIAKGNADNVPLIKTLNKIGYQFKWVGAHGKNCKLYNINFCIDNLLINNGKNVQKKDFVSYYVLHAFMKRSPLVPIYSRINNYFFKFDKTFKVEQIHQENDGIKIFLDKIKNYPLNQKPHFFLIHSALPHQPYLYKKNCSLSEYNNKSWNGYQSNYLCAIKRTNEFINYINENDPNSIVIIQSDHSIANNTYKPYKNKTFTHYDIFNLIKINKECKKYLSNKIDQVNGVRLALYCATEQNVNLLEKKSYFVDFEIGNASIGGRFILKEIKTFKDELAAK